MAAEHRRPKTYMGDARAAPRVYSPRLRGVQDRFLGLGGIREHRRRGRPSTRCRKTTRATESLDERARETVINRRSPNVAALSRPRVVDADPARSSSYRPCVHTGHTISSSAGNRSYEITHPENVRANAETAQRIRPTASAPARRPGRAIAMRAMRVAVATASGARPRPGANLRGPVEDRRSSVALTVTPSHPRTCRGQAVAGLFTTLMSRL